MYGSHTTGVAGQDEGDGHPNYPPVPGAPEREGSADHGHATSALWHVGGRELPSGVPGPVAGRIPAKLGIVNEEADETVFWLELMIDTAVLPPRRMKPLLNEAHELAAIFTAAYRTARGK